MTTSTEPVAVYVEGTVIRIADPDYPINIITVALQPWDEKDQRCPDEVVYSGYEAVDYRLGADAPWIVKELRDGALIYCPSGAYQPQFHDEGGLRIVGRWSGGQLVPLSEADEAEWWAIANGEGGFSRC